MRQPLFWIRILTIFRLILCYQIFRSRTGSDSLTRCYRRASYEYKSIYSNIYVYDRRRWKAIASAGRFAKIIAVVVSARTCAASHQATRKLRRTGKNNSDFNPKLRVLSFFERFSISLPTQTLLMDGKYFDETDTRGIFSHNLAISSIGTARYILISLRPFESISTSMRP